MDRKGTTAGSPSQGIQNYKKNMESPWGKLFYQVIWDQLGTVQGKRILDFGSGFGATADHYGAGNQVTALEPNEEMVQMRFCSNHYEQIVGGEEQLVRQPDDSYDLVLCHNVLEYVQNREAVFRELLRVCKPGGVLSLVKHNRMGKILQKAVFEYAVEDTLRLLEHEDVDSVSFGRIHEYETQELLSYAEDRVELTQCYGVRIFFGLQRNELKQSPDWLERMFLLERRADQVPELRDVAFFHHLLLTKKN